MFSKLPDVATTIFTVMSALADEHDAINLSQGFPDFDPPQILVDGVAKAMRDGHNQYPPMAGTPALRQAIAQKIANRYGHDSDWDREITVTSGATEALMNAVAACIHPGDEALILDPAYDAYRPLVQLFGGEPVHVALNGQFQPDIDALQAAVTTKTRLLFLNTPHNPTGAVVSPALMRELGAFAQQHNLHVVADEVYEHMTFDGRRHYSALQVPALAERSFVISSFGKTYHCTGWKVGYCVAPPAMSGEFRKIHQFNTFTSSTPFQVAFAEVLGYPELYTGLSDFYQRKRDTLLRAMEGTGFRATASAGTYFQLFDYSALSDEPDTDFVRRMTREAGVAAIPLSVFYGDGTDRQLIRLCFAKQDEVLRQAADQLRGWS